jgi:hypothetical protein
MIHMIKLMNKSKHYFKTAIVLLLLISLSGCGVFYNQQQLDGFLIESNELLAKGYTFDRIEIRRFLDVEEVFSISNEEELALLIMKNFEKNNLRTNYISQTELSLQHVYLYIETLLPDSFYLQAGRVVYSDPLGNESSPTKFVDVVIDQDRHQQSILAAESIISELNLDGKSDRDKVKAIHDYIILNTGYDEPLLELDISAYQNHPSFTPYGVYYLNTAVCSGYARAFMQLTRLVGIPSIMVSSQNMNHAWNIVYVENEWLFLDATWNDPIPDREGRVLYTYYLQSFDQFKALGHHYFDLASDQTLGIDQVLRFADFAFVMND